MVTQVQVGREISETLKSAIVKFKQGVLSIDNSANIQVNYDKHYRDAYIKVISFRHRQYSEYCVWCAEDGKLCGSHWGTTGI